ncbi:MAG: aminotransferase class I/II-fold pyridoxal phosphate-dependent enzyme, partial [Anaerolineaceae bacterium]|nr:aminotransferase class I/II-fold pyridoxal phosphate-dependent enzyme [Anaerolineaceae bacterium]
MIFSQRVNGLKAEGAYQVLARAKALEAQGHHIIHLEIGEPDFETPANIRTAAIAAIEDGRTKYTSPAGIKELREAIAEYASQRRGNMSIRPNQVVVGPGTKPALFFPALALVDPGDEVIYPDPGFPTYAAMIEVAGGIPVPVPLSEESGFSFDLDVFDRLVNEKTRLILINTPGSNPTGGVIPLEDLEHIAEAAQRFNCWVLSDEIYERITYDGIKVHSIASLPGMADRTVIADGFSKSHAMTGWRLGYGIMPEALA